MNQILIEYEAMSRGVFNRYTYMGNFHDTDEVLRRVAKHAPADIGEQIDALVTYEKSDANSPIFEHYTISNV